MNWFLNADQAHIPSAPATAFAHIGLGNNIICVDPEHDVVAVMRWIDGGAIDGFVAASSRPWIRLDSNRQLSSGHCPRRGPQQTQYR